MSRTTSLSASSRDVPSCIRCAIITCAARYRLGGETSPSRAISRIRAWTSGSVLSRHPPSHAHVPAFLVVPAKVVYPEAFKPGSVRRTSLCPGQGLPELVARHRVGFRLRFQQVEDGSGPPAAGRAAHHEHVVRVLFARDYQADVFGGGRRGTQCSAGREESRRRSGAAAADGGRAASAAASRRIGRMPKAKARGRVRFGLIAGAPFAEGEPAPRPRWVPGRCHLRRTYPGRTPTEEPRLFTPVTCRERPARPRIRRLLYSAGNPTWERPPRQLCRRWHPKDMGTIRPRAKTD